MVIKFICFYVLFIFLDSNVKNVSCLLPKSYKSHCVILKSQKLFCQYNNNNEILMDDSLKVSTTEKKPIGSVPEFALPSDSIEETPFQRV